MPNITLYVPQYIADNLSSEENKSGLVSGLLANYYAGKTRVTKSGLDANELKKQKFDDLKKSFPPMQNPPVVHTLETPPNKQYFVGDPEQLSKIMGSKVTVAPPEYAA